MCIAIGRDTLGKLFENIIITIVKLLENKKIQQGINLMIL